MAYTLDISLSLGTSKINLTLVANLVDSSGQTIGTDISTGFTEIGSGNYLWHYELFPDNFRGGIKFYDSNDMSTVLAFTALNPEDAELIKNINNNILENDKNVEIDVGHSEQKYNIERQSDAAFVKPEVTIETGVK